MRTQFTTPKKYADIFLSLVDEVDCSNGIRPKTFIRVMKHHRGMAKLKDVFGETEDGLELKNPLVLALGDSVTAGHFEFAGNPREIFEGYRNGSCPEETPVEITDARECYLEKFRMLLIDRYEQTSVSTVNSGIAGDTIIGMQRRLYRDVIRYQPDLAILNASLNWGPNDGTIGDYARILAQVVHAMRSELTGDIVLLTPNMEAPSPFANTEVPLVQRVNAVRELAEHEGLPLVDVYRIWETYVGRGYPLDVLLANGINHPSTVGHEVYARALMKLMD